MRDEAEVELKEFMESDWGVGNRMTRDFIPNLDKKVKAGKYDSSLAPKLWLYLVDYAAEEYVGQHVVGKRESKTVVKREARRMFPTELRKRIADKLRDEYEAELPGRGFHFHKNRELCDHCKGHEKREIERMGEAQLRAFEGAEAERKARHRRPPNF